MPAHCIHYATSIIKVGGEGAFTTRSQLDTVGMQNAINLFPDSGRLAGNSTKGVLASSLTFPSYLTLYNGSTAASLGKFIHNNNDYGGTGGAMNATVKALVDKIRAPAQRRYGPEFFVATVTMGGTTVQPLTVGGVTYYYSLFPAQGPRLPAMTFHAYLYAVNPIAVQVNAGQVLIKNGGAPITSNHVLTSADGWVSVAIQDAQEPYNANGYSPSLINIYAQIGSSYHIACPALFPGVVNVDPNAGIVTSIHRWQP